MFLKTKQPPGSRRVLTPTSQGLKSSVRSSCRKGLQLPCSMEMQSARGPSSREHYAARRQVGGLWLFGHRKQERPVDSTPGPGCQVPWGLCTCWPLSRGRSCSSAPPGQPQWVLRVSAQMLLSQGKCSMATAPCQTGFRAQVQLLVTTSLTLLALGKAKSLRRIVHVSAPASPWGEAVLSESRG